MNENLLKLSWFISKLVKQDTAPVVVVDGKERFSGKSTLASWIGMQISEFTGVAFDVDNFVWDSKYVIEKIRRMPRYSVVILDEGGLDSYARRAMSKSNVELNQAIMVCGFLNQTVIVNIPNFWDLDGYIRDRRCDFWYHAEFGFKGTQIVRGFADVASNLSQSKWKGTPFWTPEGYVNFPDMPRAFKKRYKKLKEEESIRRIYRDKESEKNSKRDVIRTVLENRTGYEEKYGRVSNRDLCRLLGVSEAEFYRVQSEV